MGEYVSADMIPLIYVHFAIVMVPVLVIDSYKRWLFPKPQSRPNLELQTTEIETPASLDRAA